MILTDTLRNEHRQLEPLIQTCEKFAPDAGLEDIQRAGKALQGRLCDYLGHEIPLLRMLDTSIAAHQGPLEILRLERAELAEALDRLERTTSREAAHSLLRYAAAVAGTLFDDEEKELFPIADSFLDNKMQGEPLWQPLETETLQIA